MEGLPLSGVRVLDLTRLLPGPLCTLMLADLGAEILKVEPPEGGDYTRWFPPVRREMGGAFAALNRNKRSLALNLKAEDGVAVLRRLIPEVDVLVEGFRPGVMARLGLDYDTVRAWNPALVYCSISGYGQTGPMAHRAGHDINYLARTGLLSLVGPRDDTPSVPAFQVADVTGGSWASISHILAALFRRERTGEGAFCDVAMTEGLLPFLVMELGQMASGADTPRRGETVLGGGVPCYGVYACADGGALAVGSLEPKFWMKLVMALELEGHLDAGLALDAEGEATRKALAQVFRTKTRDEWAAILEAHDVCVEPVLSVEEIFADPQLVARGAFETHDHPTEGTFRLPRSPFRIAATTPPSHRGAPALGQHSRAVLREFDFEEKEIQALIDAGVVGALDAT